MECDRYPLMHSKLWFPWNSPLCSMAKGFSTLYIIDNICPIFCTASASIICFSFRSPIKYKIPSNPCVFRDCFADAFTWVRAEGNSQACDTHMGRSFAPSPRRWFAQAKSLRVARCLKAMTLSWLRPRSRRWRCLWQFRFRSQVRLHTHSQCQTFFANRAQSMWIHLKEWRSYTSFSGED